MRRQRSSILAILGSCSLLGAACSIGPIAFGLPVSGSSSARVNPEVELNDACAPAESGGHIKVEVDSTAGADPDYVAYVVYNGDDTPPEQILSGPVGHHFETIDFRNMRPGECDHVNLFIRCSTPCVAWMASSQTFTYRFSLVP